MRVAVVVSLDFASPTAAPLADFRQLQRAKPDCTRHGPSGFYCVAVPRLRAQALPSARVSLLRCAAHRQGQVIVRAFESAGRTGPAAPSRQPSKRIYTTCGVSSARRQHDVHSPPYQLCRVPRSREPAKAGGIVRSSNPRVRTRKLSRMIVAPGEVNAGCHRNSRDGREVGRGGALRDRLYSGRRLPATADILGHL